MANCWYHPRQQPAYSIALNLHAGAGATDEPPAAALRGELRSLFDSLPPESFDPQWGSQQRRAAWLAYLDTCDTPATVSDTPIADCIEMTAR